MDEHPDTTGRDPGWARSFGGVAHAYERGRPGYPEQAAAWLVGPAPATVLELGAGTGKLTAMLTALGHDVLATDPEPALLERLRANVPEARVQEAPAEEIPLGDGSVDVVVAAQSFHWFDLDRALSEIARVLRPGGHLGLVWNERDERIPWVRRLGALIGTQDQLREPAAPLADSGLFGEVEEASFDHWQTIDRNSIQDLVLSRSNIAVLDESARAAKVAEVLAFYDDYGRGMDGMQLPYQARCFRAVVLDRPPVEEPFEEGSVSPASDREDGEPSSTAEDTGMLLIDFR